MKEKTCQLQDTEDCINVPSLVGSESLRSKGYLSSHAQLELVIRNLEESQQFSDENPDIGFVDQCVRQFQCTPSDGDIAISQTVKDDVPMPLYGVGVDRNNLVERVQGHISEEYEDRSLDMVGSSWFPT